MEKITVDLSDYRTVNYYSKNTRPLDEEAPDYVLYSVKLLSSMDWMSFLDERFTGLLSRSWQFKEKLSEKTLKRLEEELPEYVGGDRPERRIRKRKGRG